MISIPEFPLRFRYGRHMLEWGEWIDSSTQKVHYMYYFCWWNFLKKEHRYWGRMDMYYDGPHCSFGFWYFNISWSFPWSKVD